MYQPTERRTYRMPASIITAIIGCIVLCRAVAVFGGVPLPEFCTEKRPDKKPLPDTVTTGCADSDKVHRFFFNSARLLRCKKFSLCPSPATYLDQQTADGVVLNYFKNIEDCEQACTDVVQCSLEPLLNISNGYPVALTGEGEGERIEYGAERNFGYRDKVTFGCNESYRLVAESIRVCTLDGTWTGTQPHCEIQCPKPEVDASVSLSPLQVYYNVGQKVQVDCMDGMDGNATWTCKEDGTWESPDPTCSPSCAPQIIDNARPPVIDVVESGVTYTYQCNAGYLMLNNSSTLRCINGQLDGPIPVCTRVFIRKENGVSLNVKNGTFHFNMVKGAVNKRLTCGLDGMGEQEYSVTWVLPRKPNGEVPPDVVIKGNTLTFSRAVPEQDGEYICTTAGKNTSVIVDVNTTAEITPPMVDYFYPEGEFECSPGATEVITSLTTGSQPLNVTWRHNGNEVINDSTINSTQFIFLKINDPESEEVFSQLTIRGVGAVAQGTYKIVVRNDAGQDESQEAQLMLAQQSRGRREAPFCNEDPRKVVLVGVVRRTGRTSSGLHTIRLRVDKVLRGEADGISHRSSVEIRIFTGGDSSRLHRGQKVVLSGVARGNIIYMFDSPIENYSSSLEKEILNC